jgi:hypothetical protein
MNFMSIGTRNLSCGTVNEGSSVLIRVIRRSRPNVAQAESDGWGYSSVSRKPPAQPIRTSARRAGEDGCGKTLAESSELAE